MRQRKILALALRDTHDLGKQFVKKLRNVIFFAQIVTEKHMQALCSFLSKDRLKNKVN